jgi:hypothetical protein
MEGPKLLYYCLAWRPLLSHYNGPLWIAHTALTIALRGGFYLNIIMDRYGGPHTALTLALYGGLYLAIIMDGYGWTLRALTIDLYGGF